LRREWRAAVRPVIQREPWAIAVIQREPWAIAVIQREPWAIAVIQREPWRPKDLGVKGPLFDTEIPRRLGMTVAGSG